MVRFNYYSLIINTAINLFLLFLTHNNIVFVFSLPQALSTCAKITCCKWTPKILRTSSTRARASIRLRSVSRIILFVCNRYENLMACFLLTGDYLGEKNDFNEQVLKAFVELHDFTNLILVQALR